MNIPIIAATIASSQPPTRADPHEPDICIVMLACLLLVGAMVLGAICFVNYT